ncbi:hypothetical protein [Baekduia alba]|uniref:hypothetical protein n=1 Tax=Baekduia alba TaxID=2997333 RepID=UPI0023403233|nr:hypothetical protein [Baekduia alba]
MSEIDALCRVLLGHGEVRLAHRVRHAAAEWEHVCAVMVNKPAPTVVPFRPVGAERRPLDRALLELRGRVAA